MRHLIIAIALFVMLAVGLFVGTSSPSLVAVAQDAEPSGLTQIENVRDTKRVELTLDVDGAPVTVPAEITYDLSLNMLSDDVVAVESPGDELPECSSDFRTEIFKPEGVAFHVDWSANPAGSICVLQFSGTMTNTGTLDIKSGEVTFQLYNEYATMWENLSVDIDKLSKGGTLVLHDALPFAESDGETQFAKVKVDADWAEK